MADLAAKFLESYERGHERDDVANYGHYFLVKTWQGGLAEPYKVGAGRELEHN